MSEIDRLNGKHEDDCLLLARRWAQAVRRDPPASGDFLADDLDRIAAEIERLRADYSKLQDVLAADFQEMSRLRAENGRLRAVLATHGWLSDRGVEQPPSLDKMLEGVTDENKHPETKW